MSWSLITSIQKETDLRMILPFGLNLQLGDVIGVGKDGGFTLEGSAPTLLGVAVGTPRAAGPPAEVFKLSGDDAKCEFKAGGQASSLFPKLPTASAKVDVSLDTARSWVLAMTSRRLQSLDEVNRFRAPILKAYKNKVWKPDWALVTSIATADRMTLLASRTAGTKVALTVDAGVTAGPLTAADLTAGVSIAATSQEITQCIFPSPAAVACTAVRVRDPWWRRPDVGALAEAVAEADPATATDAEFWESMDEGVA